MSFVTPDLIARVKSSSSSSPAAADGACVSR